ncbi:MAG: hypothetical protein A2033_14315 [Bacteroidetes bacterium GWA2_31_9]|nr:MAG: hypothetical protein A2033_14315 [Bacteroidetes bacterium GWA2_31_9]
MLKSSIVLALIVLAFFVQSQNIDTLLKSNNCLDSNRVSYTSTDSLLYYKITDSLMTHFNDSTISIIDVANCFINTKYGSGNRGKSSQNKILINFSELDCVTYVETVLAIYKTIRTSKLDFCSFIEEVENIKYRDGKKLLFPSRLHYFSEWLLDNTRRGNLKDVTALIDSVKYSKTINYMTQNRSFYPQLKDTSFFNEMKIVENNLNKNQIYYLPKNKFDDYKTKIKHGNIIVFTTTTEGLDVSHVGLTYWKNNELYLLHASSKFKNVIISDVTLKEYLNKNSKVSGIMVAEIL